MSKFFRSLFGKNKMNTIEEIKKLLDRIDSLQKIFYYKRIPDAISVIVKVYNKLDNPNIQLSITQIKELDNLLTAIEKHAEKSYTIFIKRKCQQMEQIIVGIKKSEVNSEIIESNEDKLMEMQADLDAINESIKKTEKDMDSAINEENKNEWNRLNAQKTMLIQKQKLKLQSFNSLLAQQTNVGISSYLEEAKSDADYINTQQDLVDMDVAKNNAETSSYTAQEVRNMSGQLDKIIDCNFGSTEEDCLYERTLEKALMREKGMDEVFVENAKEETINN